MQNLNLADVTNYVKENIGQFHEKRIQSLESLTRINRNQKATTNDE